VEKSKKCIDYQYLEQSVSNAVEMIFSGRSTRHVSWSRPSRRGRIAGMDKQVRRFWQSNSRAWKKNQKEKSLSTLAIAEVAQRVGLASSRVNHINEAEKKRKKIKVRNLPVCKFPVPYRVIKPGKGL
jgi:hypothetical protein